MGFGRVKALWENPKFICAKFVESSPNYYFEKDGVVKPLPAKKKDLLKAYAQNGKALKSYMKENKISLKKESDLVKLAGYLATF